MFRVQLLYHYLFVIALHPSRYHHGLSSLHFDHSSFCEIALRFVVVVVKSAVETYCICRTTVRGRVFRAYNLTWAYRGRSVIPFLRMEIAVRYPIIWNHVSLLIIKRENKCHIEEIFIFLLFWTSPRIQAVYLWTFILWRVHDNEPAKYQSPYTAWILGLVLNILIVNTFAWFWCRYTDEGLLSNMPLVPESWNFLAIYEKNVKIESTLWNKIFYFM